MKKTDKLYLGLLAVMLSQGSGFGVEFKREHYNKGVAYAIAGKFLLAEKEFKSAKSPAHSLQTELTIINDVQSKKIKTITAIHLFKAVSFYRKNISQAIQEFSKALENNPKYALAYTNRGLLYANQAKYQLALQDYTKAIGSEPKYAPAYNNRALVYTIQHQYDKAIQDYTKAIRLVPNYVSAYSNRGNAYKHKGQYDLALKDFNKSIALNSKFVDGYFNRALLYDKKGLYREALRDQTMVIKLNPRDAQAYSIRGYLYLVRFNDKLNGCADVKIACHLGRCNNYQVAIRQGSCKR